MNLFTIFCFICFVISVLAMISHSCFSIYLKMAFISKKSNSRLANFPESDQKQLLYYVIQLPVYNEKTDMVKNLIDSVCSVQYPRDRLIIQLLDDSDQHEISSCLQDYVDKRKAESPDLQLFYLHRENRNDYKAGNLNFGLEQLQTVMPQYSSWDPTQIIISIFDADFIVPDDYLTRISKHFNTLSVGVVQTSTTFRNEHTNNLTKAQAVFQDNLHSDELSRRSKLNHLSMFRGSAGSLRLATIIDSGYWQGDTQIEDVDLSFLAQCNGWRIIYDDYIVCTSLLPEDYYEFKLQQRSWMKGLMEVGRKRLRQIFFSEKLTLLQKIVGFDFFLVLSLQALFMIIAHLLLIPTYYYWCSISNPETFNWFLSTFVALLFLTHIPFFLHESKSNTPYSLWHILFSFYLMTAMFVTLSYGLMEGLLGGKVHRHRTGKGAQQEKTTEEPTIPGSSITILKKINMLEIAIAFYSIALIIWAFSIKEYLIGGVYSILAIIYPLNAVLSYLSIRRIKTNKRLVTVFLNTCH